MKKWLILNKDKFYSLILTCIVGIFPKFSTKFERKPLNYWNFLKKYLTQFTM